MSDDAQHTDDDLEPDAENTDDGAAGTLEKPRTEDEGGEGTEDTIPDA